MPSASLVLPEDFEDYEWELPSKGWYGGAVLTTIGKSYRLVFYDSVRLS